MGNITFDTSVRYLTGVGEKRAAELSRIGIVTVRDLLYHFPRAYQHRGNVKLLSEAVDGETCAFILTVSSAARNAMVKGRMTLTKLHAFDESGKCNITFFNQGYLSKEFTVGRTFRFWGKLQKKKGNIYEMTSPSFEVYEEGFALAEFFPVYSLTGGLTQKYMGKIISNALNLLDKNTIEDILPEDMRRQYHLPMLDWALRAIHNPMNYEAMERARKRFIYEELYIFALAVSLSKKRSKKLSAPRISTPDLEEFYSLFGFEPTGAQRRVVSEIASDMAGGEAMSRLVQGDVGSGKTLCAAGAVYIACKGGYQSAFMVPTEILATQHYNDLKEVLYKAGINCALLTGSTPKKRKDAIKSALLAGEIDCVIGTHALLTEDVGFMRPGLFITDEQHRFGVMQRKALGDKGKDCHMLIMSATPIPRTLALMMYGDLSLSCVDEMPPGRQKISTFLVDESYRARLWGFIEKQVKEGRQVYIVCPAIEAAEGEEGLVGMDWRPDDQKPVIQLKNATEYAEELQKAFPDIRVATMNGRMKPAEKDEIMAGFAANEIGVLVSTTVIEVGVNVPNATLMVVENAERFGLSQLHQLRGRVGRGSYKSWCILVSDAKGETALARLETMTKTNDGFVIAKKDLELRGPGDFLPNKQGSARQHGGFSFTVASVCDNMEELEKAFAFATEVLCADPRLDKAENQGAARRVEEYFFFNRNAMN